MLARGMSRRARSETNATTAGAGRIALTYGLVVFAFSWLLYANTLGNEFVWDDRTLVVENPDLRTLDGDAVARLFSTHYWDITGKPGGLYRPLSSLSFHLDYQLHEKNPRGYHATNVTLNALVCVLVFVFVLVLFGRPALALATSLLFASLPLHTENVAWVAGRTDLIATLFMLASLLSYMWWRRRSATAGIVLALVGFVAAVLAKEFALVLPPLIVLLEVGPYGPRGRRFARIALVSLVFFGIAAAFFAVRKMVLGSSVQSFEPFATGVSDTAALSLSILAHYVYELVFPFLLNAESEFPVPGGLANLHTIVGLAILALMVYSVYRWRRNGVVLMGAAVFAVGIAPVLNVFPITEVSAERFLYFPSFGFCLLMAAACRGLRYRRAGLVVLILLVGAYSARTVVRNLDWKNEASIFGTTVAAAPENARAHLNLGNVHYRDGRHRQALAEYRRALDIDPKEARAWSGSAGAHKALGEMDEAFHSMERAIALEPNNADFRNSVGLLHVQQGDYLRAVESFSQAVGLNPSLHRARFNLGLAAFNMEDYAAAISALEVLEHRDVEFVHAYYYLSLSEMRMGNRSQAIEYAERFLALHQTDDAFRRGAQVLLSGRDPGN
jgi:Tfp pilus assembly protein PilF